MCGRISDQAVMGSPLNTSVPTRLPGGKNTTAEKLLVAASELMIERASIEVSLSDIAQKILTTGGNLTMVLGNLEKLGLAHRQKCPEDRRMLIVVLTAKGKALIRKLFPEHAASIVEFMGALSPAEQEQLSDLCRKLGTQEPLSS